MSQLFTIDMNMCGAAFSPNAIDFFWALFRRGYHGTFHYMSAKHMHRYVNEFAGRLNSRE